MPRSTLTNENTSKEKIRQTQGCGRATMANRKEYIYNKKTVEAIGGGSDEERKMEKATLTAQGQPKCCHKYPMENAAKATASTTVNWYPSMFSDT